MELTRKKIKYFVIACVGSLMLGLGPILTATSQTTVHKPADKERHPPRVKKEKKPKRIRPDVVVEKRGGLKRGWKKQKQCVRGGICGDVIINDRTGEVASFDGQPAPDFVETGNGAELVYEPELNILLDDEIGLGELPE